MHPDVKAYNDSQSPCEMEICNELASILKDQFQEAENKIWHKHPVWFLDGNPIVGYRKLKAGIRLMFWSGAGFDEEKLKPGTGKFKDATITYNSTDEIDKEDLARWVKKSRQIQWDYKNIYKHKGKLERLK